MTAYSATGTINIDNEHDWLRVNLTGNTLYEVKAAGSGFSFLFVYDASGQALGTLDAYGSLLGFMPGATGTYYIDVFTDSYGGNGVGPYTLTINAVADDYRNNTTTTGNISVNGTATGTINVANEHDWFRVDLTGNTLYEVKATGLDYSYLSVYDASGQAVGASDADGSPLGFMPGATGTYYIDVSDGNYLEDGVRPYTLTVNAVADDYRNNTTTTGSIAVNGTATGTINVAREHDWLRVNLTGNTLYEVSATGLDYSYLSVYDASGQALGTLDAYGSALGFMPGATGTYYIDVYGGAYLGDGAKSYTLTINEVADDYRNNTTTTGSIAVNGTATGTINVANEHDWFRVNLTGNTLYEVTATGLGYSYLSVYDASGQELGAFDAYGSPLGFMPGATGTYYIDVSAAGYAGNGVESYTLAINAVTDDYRNNTTTTGSIAVNGTATGTINVANEHDWFRVNLTGNTLYEVTATGLEYSYLAVLDASGQTLGTLDAYGSVLGFMPGATGTYYIDVSGANYLADGVGPYTLAINAVTDDYRNNTTTTGQAEPGLALPGSPDPDTLTGEEGNDTLTGGAGNDTLNGGAGVDTAAWTHAASNYTLSFSGGTLVVTDQTATDGTDTLSNIERLRFADKTVIVESKAHGSYADLPVELYHFFIVAFNGAPGVTYMDQLAEAYRYGLSVQQIVEIFTTKHQFTDVYPTSLSHHDLAVELTNQIVKNSASASAKEGAANDIQAALDFGWSVGQVIYTVFGNLAHKPLNDPTWGNTARQFDNEIAVAKVYTEVLNQSTTDLATLRDVLAPVDAFTDVSSQNVIVTLIGQALMQG